jgi:hypothetical protein
MSVAQFVQTNFNVQDSVTYKTSIDADISVMSRIAAMFAPHQSSPAAMTITIDAGALFVSNALVIQTAQVSGTITAPVSNPRIDRAVIDGTTAVLSIVTGAEAGSPSPPAIPAGKLPCAQIYLIVGQSSIINANITDERIGTGGGGGGSSVGNVVQVVNYETGALATGSTVVPCDDTIPQNTEGDQYMSLSITPKSATNKLKIDVVWMGANDGSSGSMAVSLFQDSTANALATQSEYQVAAYDHQCIAFSFFMVAGTVSATTFKVRAGFQAAGTTSFNGYGGSRKYGGALASSITITEVQA